MVQCPIAACSGAQVEGGAGADDAGAGVGVVLAAGIVQCPIAACSGAQVEAGAGADAGAGVGLAVGIAQ